MRYRTYEPWAVEPLSELVQQAVESGLMSYFDRKSKHMMHFTNIKETLKYNIELLMTSISIKQLHFLFILFAIGDSIGIIVFIAEIIVSKYRQRNIPHEI